jgi:hypothetical protein
MIGAVVTTQIHSSTTTMADNLYINLERVAERLKLYLADYSAQKHLSENALL